MTVDWDAPNTHYSDILEYDILFQKSDGTFTQYTSGCDENAATVLASSFCTVDMLTLKSLTGLAVDSLIKVKVAARNTRDWGSYSELNSVGALI